MNRILKLAEEEIIFSRENFLQNIKYLREDFENGFIPKEYDFEVNGRKVKIIMLYRSTVTTFIASFKGLVHFRLFMNLEEGVILASLPNGGYTRMENELALKDYAGKLARYIFGLENEFGNFGKKTAKSVNNFQLWNFYNYKLLLDV